jgi:nitrite reductase/ring-hydroxylating ferredoxin subunit
MCYHPQREDKGMADFIKVANLDEIPLGSLREVKVNGEDVALANVDGEIYAFAGTCTHRGGPLGQGDLDGDVVTCPWHGGQFNVRTGEVIAMPPDENIRTYPVQVEGNEIKVSQG